MKNTKWSLAASLAGSMMVSLLPGRSGAENPSSGKPRPQTVIDQSGDTSSKIFQRASLISRPLTSNQSAEAFSHRPLSFEPNLGQIDSNVKFLSRNDAYNVALTQTGSVVSLAVGEGSTPNRDPSHLNVSRMPTPQPRKYSPLSMSLVGANAKAEIKGEDVMQAQTNYLFGTNKKEWRTGIPAYAKVKYQDLYPGIDLVYYGNQQKLEYDFVVAPGADPNRIAMKFDDAQGLRVDDKTGDLLITTADGAQLRHVRPVIYQEIGDQRQEVSGGYRILADNRVSFHLGAYDSAHPLVIDPTVAFTTFLQGNKEDWVAGIAVDPSGNSYITGFTFSTNLRPNYNVTSFLKTCTLIPGTKTSTCPPIAFAAKLGPAGQLDYISYFGGNGLDMPNAIAADATGMYITGFTGSNNFGTDAFYAGGTGDVFVAKIDTYGQFLDYATVWGGSSDEDGYAIAVDASQNVYVTGITYSSDYPTSQRITGQKQLEPNFGGVRDAFVAKLNQFGAITYSTYLGGSQYDAGWGIAVDSTGHAFVTGITYSLNFPQKGTSKSIPNSGGFNAFVTEMTPDGSGVVYSIYLGGNILGRTIPMDQGTAIAVDKSDNAFVTGNTCSTNFPVTSGAFQTTQPVACNSTVAGVPLYSAFVTKLSSAGLITYSTYLGGNGDTSGSSIGLNGAGQVYVAGNTSSTLFLKSYSISPNPTAGFVAKLTPTLNAVSSNTFLGAQINGIAVVGGAVVSPVVPSTTTIYTAGARYVPGCTLSDLNNIDGFVVKLTDTTGGIITNPLGGNPVASAGSTTATSTLVAPSTPVAVGVLNTGALSEAGVTP